VILPFLEKVDNSRNEKFICDLHNPVADYMEGFSNQNLQPLNNPESENENDNQIVFKSSMSFLSTGFSLQQSHQMFQPFHNGQNLDFHEDKRIVKVLLQNEI